MAEPARDIAHSKEQASEPYIDGCRPKSSVSVESLQMKRREEMKDQDFKMKSKSSSRELA
jgi:hypothetical protein